MKLLKIQAFSLLSLSLVACSGPSLEGDAISQPFFQALCQARSACEPSLQGQSATCVALLEAAHQGRPPLKTSAKQLDKCLQALQSSPCEALYQPESLDPCDF